MEKITLNISNMVCPRCEIVVRQVLSNQNINTLNVGMGFAVIESIPKSTLSHIEAELNSVGFELLYDKASKTIEQVKIECRNYLEKLENQTLLTTLSKFLAARVGMNYSYLSKLFSAKEERTIESFFLNLKMERVKHLLLETELSLSEIAVILQFKRLEGISVTEYITNKQIA